VKRSLGLILGLASLIWLFSLTLLFKWASGAEGDDPAPRVDLQAQWDEWLATLPPEVAIYLADVPPGQACQVGQTAYAVTGVTVEPLRLRVCTNHTDCQDVPKEACRWLD
jgi:hypothetical protein